MIQIAESAERHLSAPNRARLESILRSLRQRPAGVGGYVESLQRLRDFFRSDAVSAELEPTLGDQIAEVMATEQARHVRAAEQVRRRDEEGGGLAALVLVPGVPAVPAGTPRKALTDRERLRAAGVRFSEYLQATKQSLTPQQSGEIRKEELAGDPEEVDTEYVIFTTQQDDRVDDQCRPLHGIDFRKDDPARPVIPLHHGCRCFWTDADGEPAGQF